LPDRPDAHSRASGTVDPAAESAVLREWAAGTLSPDEAFARLYETYGPIVHAWLVVRARGADADDLFQDVWTIFCRRWREWKTEGADASDARPVLAFLFRTCHLVLLAHRRIAQHRGTRTLDGAAHPLTDGERNATTHVQLGECLTTAAHCCTDDELAVFTAKLAGMRGRDIAHTLGITEAAVDHRYRAVVTRIRARLAQPPKGQP
jgi:DNA-directed RNA polymerase specialized sigma24 family protein